MTRLTRLLTLAVAATLVLGCCRPEGPCCDARLLEVSRDLELASTMAVNLWRLRSEERARTFEALHQYELASIVAAEAKIIDSARAAGVPDSVLVSKLLFADTVTY